MSKEHNLTIKEKEALIYSIELGPYFYSNFSRHKVESLIEKKLLTKLGCVVSPTKAGEDLFCKINKSSSLNDAVYNRKLVAINKHLSSGEIDTLICLVERGPVYDGYVPSKVSRDSLIKKDLAVKVLYKSKDGYQAATYLGRDVYKYRFNGDTVREAMNNRKSLFNEKV